MNIIRGLGIGVSVKSSLETRKELIGTHFPRELNRLYESFKICDACNGEANERPFKS